MTTTTTRFVEERIKVGPADLYLMKGGAGRPLLLLHGVEGHEGWCTVHDRLASKATVLAPSHPGYGQTPAPDWINQVQHQAVFYQWYLEEAGIGPVDLVGVGLGGWIAAEMAAMCQDRLRSLTLVDAFGVRPQEGEIYDIFVTPWRQVLERSFFDPKGSSEYERLYGEGIAEFGGAREEGRTMSMKLCFRPYMYDPALPGMLARVRVPTLVVWGTEDAIAPLECGRLYQQAIRGARLQTIDGCGHFAHLERPEAVAEAVQAFTGGLPA